MKKIHSTAVTSLKPKEDGFCAQAWKLSYLDRKGQSSDAMEKGKYFEFLCIGATADGKPVQPEYLKDGKTLTAPYREIELLAELFKETKDSLCIEIEQSQVYLQTKDSAGTIDIVGTIDGRKCIMDLKYTETREDERWSEFGWGNLENKDMFQAAHYVKMWHDLHDEWLPFFYWVFGKSGWVKVIQVIITEEYFSTVYAERINTYKQTIKQLKRDNFPATPEYNKCRKCLVAQYCQSKANKPSIIKWYLSNE